MSLAHLPPLTRDFVAHFGEMGSRWGINRTVGQIYALIFVSERPLNADEIAEQLEFSRSNVSMGLKELQSWRLVNLRHIAGDRREYFEAPQDTWQIFKTLVEERRRREIEPTLSMLRTALLEEPTSPADRHAQSRMRDMYGLIEMTTVWFDDVQRLEPDTLAQLMKLGARVQRVLEFKDRLKIAGSKMDANALDALTLARIQFAANISFHIIFPSINIALGWMLLFFRLRYAATQDAAWDGAYRFWVKVFALSFALGVVSGITMSFQFGTNWPGYMEKAGNIAGPLLAYEVLTAFFLEATFLGVMLFGRDRVSPRVHLIATFLVAFGTTVSAFWILSLNSWMQTPTGHIVVDGKFHAADWWQVVFNPSFPYRLTHMLFGVLPYLFFLLAGLSAWQTLKKVGGEAAAKVLRTALMLAAVLVPVQILVGDLHGLNTLKHQPAKIAAMEGLWHTERGAPLLLFAWPDAQNAQYLYAVEVPKMASFILTHETEGEVKGLNEFPGAHPPVAPVFWAFRLMVGIGLLMLAASWLGVFFLWRRKHLPRWLLWGLAAMTFSGWVATLAGWYVTEIGRQPWIVYGLVKTADVVGPNASGMVATTLAGYLVLYVVLLLSYVSVLKYLAEKPEHAKQPLSPLPPVGSEAGAA